MDEQKAIEKLKCQLNSIAKLRQFTHGSQEFKEWFRDTKVAQKKYLQEIMAVT